MNRMRVPLLIRPMRLGDLDEVLQIENEVFPMPWSRASYVHELTHTDVGHYLVVRLKQGGEGPLLAYGGFWLVENEAHISTLAVDPRWRRKGLGELVLLNLLRWAVAEGADLATLEVRLSNRAAQSLYHKYGFQVVGERPRYYSNGETALIMTAYGIAKASYQRMLAERARALAEKLVRAFGRETTSGSEEKR